MNAINTRAEEAEINTTQAFGELLSHLWRAKYLSEAVESTFCDLLSEIDIAAKPPQAMVQRIYVLLDVLDGEIAKSDSFAADLEIAVKPLTSVGRHVDIQRQAVWRAVVEAYKAADAIPVDENADGSVFDDAAAAFQTMFVTTAPSLRALHEKMTLIKKTGGWTTHGVIEAVFTDVEYLARRYEIASDTGGEG